MKLMRNKRTGRTAVYDEALIASGNWEPHDPEPEHIPAQASPKKGKSGPIDKVKPTDTVKITVTRSSGESIEHQA